MPTEIHKQTIIEHLTNMHNTFSQTQQWCIVDNTIDAWDMQFQIVFLRFLSNKKNSEVKRHHHIRQDENIVTDLAFFCLSLSKIFFYCFKTVTIILLIVLVLIYLQNDNTYKHFSSIRPVGRQKDHTAHVLFTKSNSFIIHYCIVLLCTRKKCSPLFYSFSTVVYEVDDIAES